MIFFIHQSFVIFTKTNQTKKEFFDIFFFYFKNNYKIFKEKEKQNN